MADDSDEEVSSLYRSIKRQNFPDVKQRRKEKFQSKVRKVLSSGSSKDTTLNEHLNTSQIISQSDIPNKLIRVSRRRKTNVFAHILDESSRNLVAKSLQNSVPAVNTRSQEKNKSRNSINPFERNSYNDSNEFLDIHQSQENLPSRRPREKTKLYSREQVHNFANAFSSVSSIPEHDNSSTDPSSSIISPKLLHNISHAQNLNSKVRMPERNRARQRGALENILNSAGQSHSNEIIDSKLSSSDDNLGLSTAKNISRKKKSKKSTSVFKEILTSNSSPKNNANEVFNANSSGPLKKNLHEIHEKSPSVRDHDENEVSRFIGQNNRNFTSTFHIKHSKLSQSNIDNYFIKKKLAVLEGSSQNKEMRTAERKHIRKDYSSPTTESLLVNASSRTLRSNKNLSGIENSNSDVTFDSDIVLHSTMRNTPILKRQKDTESRINELHVPRSLMYQSDKEEYSTKSENSMSNNHLKVMAENGSNYQSKRNRSEKEHPSELYLRSNKVRSHYFKHTDASKDVSKTRNQIENDKIFTRSENNLPNQQTEDRSNHQFHLVSNSEHRSHFQQSVASDMSNNSEGVLSNVSRSKRKLKEMANNDKIVVSTSRHNDEGPYNDSESELFKLNFDELKENSQSKKSKKMSPNKMTRTLQNENFHDLNKESHTLSLNQQSDLSRTLINSKRILSDVPESNRRLKEIANNDKIVVSTSRHNDEDAYSDSESELFKLNIDKFKQSSQSKKSKKMLSANKMTRTLQNENIHDLNKESHTLSLNQQSDLSRTLINSKRILSDVPESNRRLKEMANNDKIVVSTSRHNDEGAYSDSESELFKLNFDKFKQNSQSKKSKKMSDNKMTRILQNENIHDLNKESHTLSLNQQSDLSRTLINSKRILSDVPESNRRLKEMANKDKIVVSTSGHNDEIPNNSSESELFKLNFDEFKENSQSKKSKKMSANKMTRTLQNENIHDLNKESHTLYLNQQSDLSRTLINSKRILSDVPESNRRLKEMANKDKIVVSTSGHNDEIPKNSSESELFKLNFDKFKQNLQPKKSKKMLSANKMTRTQQNETIHDLNQRVRTLTLNQSDELRSRAVAKSRKFVVRGKTVSFKKPAEWTNNRFYNKLIPFFETKFGPLKYYSECEKAVITLHNNVKTALRKPKEQEICVNNVRKILYDVGVIKSPMDFMMFADQFLPNDFNLIAIPKQIGSCVLGVPYPKGIGLFDDLKLS